METATNKENKVATGASSAPIGAAVAKSKVESFPVTGKFALNDNNRLVATLDNPFPDSPLGSLVLDFSNPNKQDRWGNKDDDRRGEKFGGAFEVCTAEAGGEVKFAGNCFYHRITDKKGKSSDYVAIYVNSPFPNEEINGGEPVRAFFRHGATQGSFDILAIRRLKITPAPRKTQSKTGW